MSEEYSYIRFALSDSDLLHCTEVTCDGVSVNSRLDCPHLHPVDRDRVLEVGVAGQPGDHRRGGADVAGLHTGGAEGSVLTNDHRTGSVPGGPSIYSDRSDTNSMRLRGEKMREK